MPARKNDSAAYPKPASEKLTLEINPSILDIPHIHNCIGIMLLRKLRRNWKDNIQRNLNVIREHCHYIGVIVSAVLKCFEADLVAVY
jgi:hypothetical protein